MQMAQWKTGDRVYRWVVTGVRHTMTGRFEEQDPQPLTVVRVNRRTVTVRTDQGSVFRLEPHEIAGEWTEDEDEPALAGLVAFKRWIDNSDEPGCGITIEQVDALVDAALAKAEAVAQAA